MPRLSRVAATAISTFTLATAAGGAHAETLREALAKAYGSNPTLMAARAELRATDESVPLAKAVGRPSVDVTGTYTENVHRDATTSILGTGFSQPVRNGVGQASLTVPIYQGGIVRNTIRSAKERVKAGQNSLRGTESSVFASVVGAYLDVIRDSAIVTLNLQNVRALEVNLQASSDRFEVGDLTRTDVAQSESRLALARAGLQSAEAQLIASKERYTEAVGSPPVDLANPPPLPGLPETPEAAVQIALTDNPDLLASKDLVDAAHYETNAAKGRIAPKVSAFANGTYQDYLDSEKAANVLNNTSIAPNTKSAAVGVQVTVPIYQGGQPGALSRQNAARESQAIERSIAVERNVISQTRAAYASWRASLQTIESTRKAVDATALSLEGVKAENSAGTRTILDILNAEQEALNARVQLVTAQRNAYVAAFSLLAAMGKAEARDLNLEGVTLYDPVQHYDHVKNKLMDFDMPSRPRPLSTTTAQTPAQTADVLTPADAQQ